MSTSVTSQEIPFVWVVYYPGTENDPDKVLRVYRQQEDARAWCMRKIPLKFNNVNSPPSLRPLQTTTGATIHPEAYRVFGTINEQGDSANCFYQKILLNERAAGGPSTAHDEVQPTSHESESSNSGGLTVSKVYVVSEERHISVSNDPAQNVAGLTWLHNLRVVTVCSDRIEAHQIAQARLPNRVTVTAVDLEE